MFSPANSNEAEKAKRMKWSSILSRISPTKMLVPAMKRKQTYLFKQINEENVEQDRFVFTLPGSAKIQKSCGT